MALEKWKMMIATNFEAITKAFPDSDLGNVIEKDCKLCLYDWLQASDGDDGMMMVMMMIYRRSWRCTIADIFNLIIYIVYVRVVIVTKS
jgi:hypothetical protein